MLTKDRLAKALREAGLTTLARQAERGTYDVLERQSDQVQVDLLRTIRALRVTDRRTVLRKLQQRIEAGEFFNTRAEIDDWLHKHPEVTL